MKGELFNGYRLSILQDDKSSGALFHNNINILSILNYTLKNNQDGKFHIILVFSFLLQ